MEEFLAHCQKQSGDLQAATYMYRSGYTVALVEKASKVGVTFKDLQEIYGMFGPPSALVLSEFVGRMESE